MMNDRLERQIAFLVEADRLKRVERRAPLIDGTRRENSAEHSWHLVLAAIVLKEYAANGLDMLRVVEMLAVHDLVEIDAGDTFAYDEEGQAGRPERERRAADRIFALLPADQQRRLRAAWDEFEAQSTTEARLANALDRLQPLLVNAHAGGGSWKEHPLARPQVVARMEPIQRAMPDVWPLVIHIIDTFCDAGIIARGGTVDR